MNNESLERFLQVAYEQGTHGAYEGDILKLSHKSFDSPRLKGVQRKGMVFFKEESGAISEKMLKMDQVNRHLNKYFTPPYDNHFSSVTETFISSLVRSMLKQKNFSCVTYDFVLVNELSNIVSGTLSSNYILPSHLEKVLTHNDQNIYHHYRVEYDEFFKYIYQGVDNKTSLTKMIEFFCRYGVEEKVAKYFIVQQAGFDLLTGNIDRKVNATNFVFIENECGKVTPINMDYGRCAQINWTKKTEEKFKEGKLQLDETDYQEIAEESLDNFGGILGNEYTIEKCVSFILESGFIPFKINLEEFKKDLLKNCQKIKRLMPQISGFVETKAQVLIYMLQDPRVKELWEEVK